MLTAFRTPTVVRAGKLTALAIALTATISFSIAQLHNPGAQWTITAIVQNKVAASPAPNSAVSTAVTVKPVSIPNCVPMASVTPAPLSLEAVSTGLTTQNDTATHYQIYGNVASDLATQIQHCAPGADGSTRAEFTAQTTYRLNWQYQIVQGDISCHLADVKVGLHTAVAMPLWQPSTSATSGLAGRWQTFITNLIAHEQGHVALDQQYANKMLTDLQAVSEQSCSELTSLISNTIDADTHALDLANDAYDVNTDHGATQGAVLPVH